jgi:hypothetical protein
VDLQRVKLCSMICEYLDEKKDDARSVMIACRLR